MGRTEREPTPEIARRLWRLLRPVALKTIVAGKRQATLDIQTRRLRARQALVVGIEVALLSARDFRRDQRGARRAGRPLTTNTFVRALAEYWSQRYQDVRDATGTTSLSDMKADTVVAIRDELLQNGVDVRKLWVVVRKGIPGLYRTSLRYRHGRKVTVIDGRKLTDYEALITADPSYQRPTIGPRLLLADDLPPPRRIDRSIAVELPFDEMTIGPESEIALQRLEAARVFVHVPSIHDEAIARKRRLAEHPWPAVYGSWKLSAAYEESCRRQKAIDVPLLGRRPTKRLREARKAALARREAIRAKSWKAFLTPTNIRLRNSYRAVEGDAYAMAALAEQVVQPSIVARTDGEGWLKIKSTFYKHTTRRFQAANIWASEVTGRDVHRELIAAFESPVDYPSGRDDISERPLEIEVHRTATRRERWFRLPASVSAEERTRRRRAAERQWPEIDPAAPPLDDVQDVVEYDISGSQPQILAVLMGKRDLERRFAMSPFKELLCESARALHRDRQSKFRLSAELREDTSAYLMSAVKDAAMTRLYGSKPREIARNLQRDPELYGPGLGDEKNISAMFDGVAMISQLLEFLPVAEAVGHASYAADPTAGVEIVDPLDHVTFRWNPLKRRKRPISSGSFKLYVREPIARSAGHVVDRGKLVRRIAPGVIHMCDSFFAAHVLENLHAAGVKDVLMIHDAWIVPLDAETVLVAAIRKAGEAWLRGLGPVYDFLEKYLSEESRHGPLVRRWRSIWQERIVNCEAGRDDWPHFNVKRQSADVEYQ